MHVSEQGGVRGVAGDGGVHGERAHGGRAADAVAAAGGGRGGARRGRVAGPGPRAVPSVDIVTCLAACTMYNR